MAPCSKILRADASEFHLDGGEQGVDFLGCVSWRVGKHPSRTPFGMEVPTEKRCPACICEWDPHADVGSHGVPIHIPALKPRSTSP